MRQNVMKAAAIACTIATASCAANSQFTGAGPSNRTTGSHTNRLPETIRHGAEIESGKSFMISEGNYHVGFPPSATLARTADGIVVTYNGVSRTFSPSARVDVGTYHRYAKASDN